MSDCDVTAMETYMAQELPEDFKESECPSCFALNRVDYLEKYMQISCSGCGIELEWGGCCLIELSE